MKKNKIWDLFITFLKIGAFTFGGGYAMIPLIEREMVENKKWINEQDMLDMVVIAESTPGVIAVNSATFCGYRVGGFWGGIIATLGVVLPSYAVICALSFILDIAFENFWVMAAFRGVRACVAVLIFNAFLKMFKQVPKNIFTMSIAVIAFTLVAFFNINTIFVLLGAAIVGVVYCAIVSSRKKKLTTETSADKLLPSATEIEESGKKDEASTKEDKR